MTSTTSADRLLKWQVVHDALSIVVPSNPAAAGCPASSSSHQHTASPMKSPRKKGAALQQELQYPVAAGCMQLIHHDGLDAAAAGRKPGKRKKIPADAAGAAFGSPSAAVRKRIVLHG